jgi:hypothetical protein
MKKRPNTNVHCTRIWGRLHNQKGVPVLEKNKNSMEAAKPGFISPARTPGTGSVAGKPEAVQKNIHPGIVHRSARFMPGISGKTP